MSIARNAKGTAIKRGKERETEIGRRQRQNNRERNTCMEKWQ